MEQTVYVITTDSHAHTSYRGLFDAAALRMEVCPDIATALNGAEDGPSCALVEHDGSDPFAGLDGRAKLRKLPIIVIHPTIDLALAVHVVRNGAWDFLVKPVDDYVLIATIRQALASDKRHYRAYDRRRQWLKRLNDLTPRERQVMQLVVNGNPNKDIASRMDVTVKTVEVHRARVMQKMGAQSLPQLVIQGIHLGFVDPD